MTEILMIVVAVLGFAIIVLAIANYKKRIQIYEEYSDFFGPFKAYIALNCTAAGFFMFISGFVTIFIDFGLGITNTFFGLAVLAVGVLIYYLTDKKAKAAGINGIIKKMVLAAFGTVWSIELKILKIACFFWLISALKGKNKVVIYRD